MIETWKPIPDYAGYYASDQGRIKKNDKILKEYVNHHVSIDGHCRYVHRLVMEAFVGKSPLHINHIDSNRRNSSLVNLEYISPIGNKYHSLMNKYRDINIGKFRYFEYLYHIEKQLS